MSAEYKVNMKVGEGGNSLVHLTIRTEKHLFLDRRTIPVLKGAIEEEHQSDDSLWFDLVYGVETLLSRYPERPDPTILGLESPWRSLPSVAAEKILERYYQKEGDSLRFSMSGDARGATILLTIGAASLQVSVAPAEAQQFLKESTALKELCAEGVRQGKTSPDIAADARAALAGGAVLTGAGKAAYDCAAAVVSEGTDVRSTVSCLGDLVTIGAGYVGLIADAERRAAAAAKERADHQRDFERCSAPIDGNKVDIDRVERAVRTG